MQSPAEKTAVIQIVGEASQPFWMSATFLLIAINVAVFLVSGSNRLVIRGALFARFTLQGEYWRVVTSIFLHSGILHLVLNMIPLWVLARPIERLIGRTMTLAIYLLSGIGGSLLYLHFDRLHMTVGASGSVFGFIGVIVAFWFARIALPPAMGRSRAVWMTLALVGLLLGQGWPVAETSHVGGLLTGIVIGAFFSFTFKSPANGGFRRQMAMALVVAVVLGGIFAMMVHSTADIREADLGDAAIEKQDYATAITHYRKATTLRPANPAFHADLGTAFYLAGQWQDAQREYERAMALGMKDHLRELHLANIDMTLRQPEKAVPLYRDAISDTPFDSGDYLSYGIGLWATGDFRTAEIMLRNSAEMDPDDESPHQRLSGFYEQLSRKAEARREKKIAEELLKKQRPADTAR